MLLACVVGVSCPASPAVCATLWLTHPYPPTSPLHPYPCARVLWQMRTQSFLNLLRPQLPDASSAASVASSAAVSRTGGLGGFAAGFAAAHFYRTTSDDTYGSFAKPPPLPNTTGALRQPLFLSIGVGARTAE